MSRRKAFSAFFEDSPCLESVTQAEEFTVREKILSIRAYVGIWGCVQ
ncbi:hypothetical protein [Methanosarcina horonobensis]|nr:hypothetical protein [Methanosarcina horonobensis]